MSGHGRKKKCSGSTKISKSRRPGKLVDGSRAIQDIGTTRVDNEAAISPDLATQAAKKAFRLRISVKITETGEDLV